MTTNELALALGGGSDSGIVVSPTSLRVTDPSLPMEEFERLFGRALRLGDAARWWIGDLILFGQDLYSESYAQVLDAAGMTERQADRYRYVCQQVARSRRRGNLSFSHHEEVASLDPDEQNRLLADAEENGWSVAVLRDRLRDVRALARAQSGRQQVLPAPVDAARGISAAGRTLETLARGLEPGTAETLGVPAALRGLEEAARVVRDLEPMLSLGEAVEGALVAGVLQTGLASPAYIVPSGPWEALAEAYRRATRR